MADTNPLSLWRRLLALPNESRTKTFAVAIIVSVVSAVVVSTAAITLQPLQQANRAAERQARMDAMLATMPGMADLIAEAGADTLETLIVDLDSATLALDMDPDSFDVQAVAADPETSTAIPREADVAGIGRRPDLAQIHVLRDASDRVVLVILPVYAVGYQSTIRALLALEGDFNTVAGLTVTEQGETPGLGSRIEDAAWQSLWPGRQVADADGVIRLAVVRGAATSEYEVDGITGATRTGNAFTAMIAFWLGPDGYGPVLDRLREGGL